MRALAAVCLLGACSSSHDTAPARTTTRRDAAAVPSFARDIAPVLEKHCTGKECHGEEPPVDVTLDLRPAAAYHQLVRVPAEMGEAHLLRVNPGNPDDSMLVHKLTGRLGFKEGKRMPIDDQTGEPILPSPLPPDFVDGAILPWIRAGAPDN